MKAGQKKKVYSVEERLAHVAAFKASGKSLREYELATGVKDQTLYNWVSGRNLKTQAKNAEVKKAKVKKTESKSTQPKLTTYTNEQRLKHLEALKSSGKTAKAYALENGLNTHTLYGWLKGRNIPHNVKPTEIKPGKVIARVEAPIPSPVVPTRSERFWAWYADARPNLLLGTDVLLVVLLVLDLIARHK